MVVIDDGKERDPVDDMGNPGRSLGIDSPGHSANGRAQSYGPQAYSPQANPGRYHIPLVYRLPLQPPAP